MDMLRYSSVSEEHRTLMGTVVERIMSARRGLIEAFTDLLRGFEVRNVIFSIMIYMQSGPVYR